MHLAPFPERARQLSRTGNSPCKALCHYRSPGKEGDTLQVDKGVILSNVAVRASHVIPQLEL